MFSLWHLKQATQSLDEPKQVLVGLGLWGKTEYVVHEENLSLILQLKVPGQAQKLFSMPTKAQRQMSCSKPLPACQSGESL